MQQNRYFSGRECGRWNTVQESQLAEDQWETAWFLRPLYLYLTRFTIYQRVLLAEGRKEMVVGRGRGKGQFQSSLKVATPRRKVLQWVISGRTASVERNLAKASNLSSLSPLCLFWKLPSFQEMSNNSGFGEGEAYTDEGTAVTHDVISLPALHSFKMEKSNSFNLANR